MPIVGGQSAHHCAYLLQLYQQILGVDQLPTDIYGGMTTMLADDFGQIEGRTEDQHIGLLTEFAKKLISLSWANKEKPFRDGRAFLNSKK